jgi:hypothetical protein
VLLFDLYISLSSVKYLTNLTTPTLTHFPEMVYVWSGRWKKLTTT